MARITKTQLTHATNDLVEAAGVAVHHWLTKTPYSATLTPYKQIVAAHTELMRLRNEADHAAAANHRNTSIAAARLIEPTVNSIRRRILLVIASQYRRGNVGCTDEQLETRTRRPHSTVSAARNHLFNIGWLQPSGQYQDTVANVPAIVWTLTPAAIEQLPDLLGGSHGETENPSA